MARLDYCLESIAYTLAFKEVTCVKRGNLYISIFLVSQQS